VKEVLSIILGGGQGQRLFPLTKDRSKPAVPICGKYRLIDISVGNCLNSHINRIYILTQFNSASLNRHISHTYRFDDFHNGFVDILAAEQSIENRSWYQGTADAVRKNLRHIQDDPNIKYILILSGDQIYSMNFQKLLYNHIRNKADITIAVTPIKEKKASSFGLVKVTENMKICDFIEKPQSTQILKNFDCSDIIKKKNPNTPVNKPYLASMGIYLFNKEVLFNVLNNNLTDFGNDIIPMAIRNKRVCAHIFRGFWEDVGTIKSFWETHIGFTKFLPNFDFNRISLTTHYKHLQVAKIYKSKINETLLCEGSLINNADISSSIIGIRSIIQSGVRLRNSIMMGADYYENNKTKEYNALNGKINIGIGENTIIENAIIDKNARIGKNCKITNPAKFNNFDGENFFIRDGIVIIPKDAQIPDYTII
jgi:glucose-1-phosphate adenylyltransferase